MFYADGALLFKVDNQVFVFFLIITSKVLHAYSLEHVRFHFHSEKQQCFPMHFSQPVQAMRVCSNFCFSYKLLVGIKIFYCPIQFVKKYVW